MAQQLVVIAHNIRSTHNIGALLRTSDGLGVTKVFLTGYTPYPMQPHDERLPYIATKLDKQIHKTALGAEHSVIWEYREDIASVLAELRLQEYVLAGLEQTSGSQSLPGFKAPERLAVLLGSEVEGIDPALLTSMDVTLEIPMRGKKESFNVIEAASMALYHCTYMI